MSSPCKMILKFTHILFLYQPKFFKLVKCLRHTLFSLFKLWQISKIYLQQLINTLDSIVLFYLITCLKKPNPFILFIQILLNYLEKAYSVRKCLIAGPSFAYNVLVRAKCSTFFFDDPPALLKFWIEPYAALPLDLFILTFSDLERDPISSLFCFCILANLNFRWKLRSFQISKKNIWKLVFFCCSANRKSTIDFFVSWISNKILPDWLSSILGEFKIKSIRCLLLLVFNLAFTAL